MRTQIFKLTFATVAFLCCLVSGVSRVTANDLPLAAGSPIAGITFDDRPLMLPPQRNFQMAMLTASSELGRSCGRMESYGWRMAESEQDRVNVIFNNTVDRLRAQGFVVESKASNVVSSDVTLFTADRTDRHLIFLWSAGEIGLVMVLCETSAPLSPIPDHLNKTTEASQAATLPSHLPMAQTVRASGKLAQQQADKPVALNAAGKPSHGSFSPVGKWIGSYTCSQGTTGATLTIDKVKGDQFEGNFSFYPTPKNPYVPAGKYLVFGEYDADSQRILVNPGKWVSRPKDYYNTIMIGSFDPINMTFSAFFQGITGCTSFEASGDPSSYEAVSNTKAKSSKKKAATKKPAAKKKATSAKTKQAAPVAKEEKTAPEKLDPVDPVPATPAPKPNMDLIKEPAPVPPQPRASSIEPPAGIVLGTPPATK